MAFDKPLDPAAWRGARPSPEGEGAALERLPLRVPRPVHAVSSSVPGSTSQVG